VLKIIIFYYYYYCCFCCYDVNSCHFILGRT
jgi:hypothetical protein